MWCYLPAEEVLSAVAWAIRAREIYRLAGLQWRSYGLMLQARVHLLISGRANALIYSRIELRANLYTRFLDSNFSAIKTRFKATTTEGSQRGERY